MSDPPAPPSPTPPPAALNVLGWAWVALGVLLPVSGLLAPVWALVHPARGQRDASGALVLGLLALPSLLGGLLAGGLAIAAGIGLRRRRPRAAGLALLLLLLSLGLVALVAVGRPDAFWFAAFVCPGPLLITALGAVTVPVLLASIGAFRGA